MSEGGSTVPALMETTGRTSLGTDSNVVGSLCPGSACAGRPRTFPLQQLLGTSVQVWVLCVELSKNHRTIKVGKYL